MWVLAAANAALLALCLFKPGARNKNEFGPVPDKSPLLPQESGPHFSPLKGARASPLLLGAVHRALPRLLRHSAARDARAELRPQAGGSSSRTPLSTGGRRARLPASNGGAFPLHGHPRRLRVHGARSVRHGPDFPQSGLSGKSFIPMLVSMGCGVPGIMATRTIEKREGPPHDDHPDDQYALRGQNPGSLPCWPSPSFRKTRASSPPAPTSSAWLPSSSPALS